MGTGNIARQFAAGVNSSAARGRIVAVGSRKAESAEQFAHQHQIARHHATYDALLSDPEVDAIYLSLPNSMHHEWTIRSLEAGKHVLCEKPLADDARQAEAMFAAADRAQRVLVEAFMYRSHPLTHAVKRALESGVIGTLRLIRTSFCYRARSIEGNIRFRPELAGGAMMDIGCYCVNFSRHFAGEEPRAVHAAAHLHDSGVDDVTSGTLAFPSGVVASFACGMSVQADNSAFLCGDEGYIAVPIPWKPPVRQAAYTIAYGAPPRMDQTAGIKTTRPPEPETCYVDAGKELYALEADDFAAAVLDGAPPALNKRDSIGNMRVLDEIRRQIGLKR